MKFCIIRHLAIIFVMLPLFSLAQIPAGYYDDALDKTGIELKNALHDIIDDHTQPQHYDDLTDEVADLDRHPDYPQYVECFYTGFRIKTSRKYDNGKGWNKEHVWPQGRGNFGRDWGAGGDLHALVACDASINSSRGDRNFDYGTDIKIDATGHESDGNLGETDCKTGRNIWEPRDEVKGDVARIIFYMAVRYSGDMVDTEFEEYEPDLEIVDEIVSQGFDEPIMGKLSTLLLWHYNDPVSERERQRNDAVFALQGNRNPFVDHPEFVARIWGIPAGFYDGLGGITGLGVIDTSTQFRYDDRCDGQACIQVGTYNLYWLGVDNRYENDLRTEDEVALLADMITDHLDLEVVVFQEVNVDEEGWVFGNTRGSKQQYQWLKQKLNAKGYELIEGTTGGAQRVIIAYDGDEVELLSSAELDMSTWYTCRLDNSCRTGNMRKALAANFKAGEFDFWVVGVHLRSALTNEDCNRDCVDDMRKQQCEDLLEAIDGLLADSDEQDVIITGDFNAYWKDNSISDLYYEGDFHALTKSDRLAWGSGKYSYVNPMFTNLIDHVMVNPYYTRELVPYSTYVLDPFAYPEVFPNYLKNYSDHVPVWTSFLIITDDD